jgi:glycosyltransferase involved in cell wall biosynthesis
VGVLTFRREQFLDSLLPQLLAQLDGLPSGIEGTILVIDNDPTGSAAAVATDRHPRIRYVHEPTPGIAAARRRCLAEADEFDLLQFIDDDEEPVDDWLATMIDTWRTYDRPAAVAGRVIPRYDVPPSDWILAGGFFDRRRHATGTRLPAAPSGNMLLDLNQIRAFGVTFDPTLGLGGGEDTLFTLQVADAGGRIVFCDDAAVTDLVPADRSTRTWVLRRSWHHGSTSANLRLRRPGRQPRWLVRIRLVVGGAARTAIGLLTSLAGTVGRRLDLNARGWKFAYRGLGIAAGGLGLGQPEYSRKKKAS